MAGHGKTSRLRIHDFRHRGNTYEVCLEELDGQPFRGCVRARTALSDLWCPSPRRSRADYPLKQSAKATSPSQSGS